MAAGEGQDPPDPELVRAATEPPPELPRRPLPWRELFSWMASVFVVLWALFLLPGVVRDVRERAGVTDAEPETVMPEIPEDPVLTPEVQELMRRGREAEASGHLVQARSLYHKAVLKEKRCFSCLLRRTVVERVLMEEATEALNTGGRYLAESRFEEAAGQYQKVLGLVPHEKANYHVLAKQGLDEAKKGAKRAGQPLPGR